MAKHSVLTEAEFRAYSPNPRTVRFLEEFQTRTGLKPHEMNVLEWGCGRGRETLWFRERGYNAFGVDVDERPIANGMELMRSKGHGGDALRLVGTEGNTAFPCSYFHCTYSNRVFEHVRELEPVAAELWRVTVAGGTGFHSYPGHAKLVEGHLFMPFVQWTPKNEMRRQLIRFWTALGREPCWAELASRGRREKAEEYFNYSINHTFYRKPRDVRAMFEKCGFEVSFETINHPAVRRHWLLKHLSRYDPARAVISRLLLTFESVEMLITKSGTD